MRARGVKSRMCPPYPERVVPSWSRVGAWTGTLKNPTKYLWRWEPDRRSNFFFSPPAHLCAVTYMTEISLIVTLNSRAVRCTENIGASRFALYGSGFDSGIPDFGSVRTLHCAFNTTMVEVENNLSLEASDSK